MEGNEDESFDRLLRRIARTPEIPKHHSRIEVGSKLAGRFEVRAKLGEGGMGQVYVAFDHEQQSLVALKVLGQQDPELIARIKREFRAVAGLSHPNLVRLHELFYDGTESFFTMELVEGETLPKLLAQSGDVSPELLRDLFGQLAAGLIGLHQAGFVHGDLKPSNFLITHADRRVVLLDFGVARPSGPAQKADASGTPRYMAPEQRRGEILSEAADWYAFGVVLHEALSGSLPPRLARPLVRPVNAPVDLADLCEALLQPLPADRPSGEEVLRRLGADRTSAPSSGLPPKPASLLIGRDRELHMLTAAFDATLDGRSAMVMVDGPSGIGKSTLVEHFVQSLRDRGVLVLAGRCRERESLGYKAVDGLIDGIVDLLDDMSLTEAASVLPPDISDLAVLFPALRAAAPIARVPKRDSESGDQALIRLRAVHAFGELIARLRKRAPLVIWLDDLQWSDTDSALLMGPLLGGSDPVPLLFVGSCRRATSDRGPMLETLRADRTLRMPEPIEIALDVLPLADAERMARALLPAEDARASSIARDAGGHPLFIAELAHVLHDQTAAHERSVSLVDLINARMQAIAPRGRQLLELVAIAGEPLPRQILRRAQSLKPAEIEEAIDLLRAHRLVRSQGLKEHDLVDIHHDRIREIVVQSMTAVRQRQHHLGLAQTLEAWPESRPARQAAHFEAAGDLARAGRYWIAAADQASRALAFVHAAQLYEKGAAQATLDRDELRAVQIRRAEALALAGKGPDAAAVYLDQAGTGSRDEALELRRRAAEQLLLSGHLDRGLAVIEQVLAAVGMRKTRGGREAVVPLLTGRALIRISGLKHKPRSESELSREQLAQLDAAWTIAWSLGLVDPIRGAEFQTRYLRLALKAGEPRRLLRALTLEASYSSTAGPSAERRTDELLTVASEIAARSDDRASDGLLCVARGIAAYLQGRAQLSLQHCNEALARLADRGSGAVWERMRAQRFMIASLFMLGRYRELAELVPPLIAKSEGTGNLYATASFRAAYSTVGWLTSDRVQEADRQLDLARAESKSVGFQIVHNNLLFGDTFRDLYSGDGERAHARIAAQWPSLQRAMFLHISVLRVQSWQMRGASAVLAAEALDAAGRTSAARDLRREARQAARVLSRETLVRAQPSADMISAAVDWAEGDESAARSRLEASIAAFDEQDMAMYAAAARSRLADIIGGDAGRELKASALARMSAERVQRPDNMLSMLAPGFLKRS